MFIMNAVIVLNFILKMGILLQNCVLMYSTLYAIIIQLSSYGSYEWTFLTKEIVYVCFHQTAFNISDMDYII
jgi:hypothetical protein